MKAEDAKKIADRALQDLTEALKAGKSEQLTQYLAMLARFHHYSFGNVLLILSQKPEATQVAGFSKWKQMGRFVKKGEKGIVIIAPMRFRPKDEHAEEQEQTEKAKPILRFRGVFVFDVSQTDGEALLEPPQTGGDPQHHLVALRAIIEERGIAFDHDDLPLGADGVSRGGRISIRAGLKPANEFSVIVHELTHEMLHRDKEHSTTKTIRETEAVAFVVCQAIGLETGSAASDYIQLYDGKAETLAASLDRIQQVASGIIEELKAPEK